MSVSLRTTPQAPVTTIFQPQTFAELMKFAEIVQHSDLLPKDYKGKPGNIVLAIQLGSEVGLSPMQSLQGIAVIGNRPAVWGDAMLGLCRQSPLCENITERMDGEGDAMVATCIAKRRGADPVQATFSVTDAKKAGLWGKAGPWTQYPARMLQNRARGFALRDAFADVLKGLKSVEELRDYGPTIDHHSEPAPLPSAPIPNAPVEDQPPPADEGPVYRIVRRDKVLTFGAGSEWIARWRALIDSYVAANATTRLPALRQENEAAFEAVAAFDPQAVAEVDMMIETATGVLS